MTKKEIIEKLEDILNNENLDIRYTTIEDFKILYNGIFALKTKLQMELLDE